MKRYLVVIIVLMIALSACTTPNQTIEPTPSPPPLDKQPKVTFEPWANYNDILPEVCVSWAYYETLSELCEVTQYIIVGTVKDIQVSVQDNERAVTVLSDEYTGYETTITYSIQVDQTIKGELASTHNINVTTMGWALNDVNVFLKDQPPLDYNNAYIMFLSENIQDENTPRVAYHFCDAFESYPEIIDGKIYAHERSRLFYDNMKADDALSMVTQEVKRQDAPDELSVQQGIQSLSQALSTEPDQTPVRELSETQMQSIYDFLEDSRIISALGKELANGDIFIWIKTQKLTSQQQKTFEGILDTAINQAADGTRYKVTCTPFHSMISICAANEDNATIHQHFWDIVQELME